MLLAAISSNCVKGLFGSSLVLCCDTDVFCGGSGKSVKEKAPVLSFDFGASLGLGGIASIGLECGEGGRTSGLRYGQQRRRQFYFRKNHTCLRENPRSQLVLPQKEG